MLCTREHSHIALKKSLGFILVLLGRPISFLLFLIGNGIHQTPDYANIMMVVTIVMSHSHIITRLLVIYSKHSNQLIFQAIENEKLCTIQYGTN